MLDAKSQEAEINNELQTETYTTKRVISEALEDILYKQIPVLDHGFIRVVDYMGDDSSIVQAARVSYGKGTKQVNQDRGLINYLMRHRHTTPFEMCDIKLHIKLPIFIARQWIRHRTASVNEYSARYSILSREFYVPEKHNIAPQSTTNAQGREINCVPEDKAAKVIQILKEDAEKCYQHYTEMMNADDAGNVLNQDDVGVARELARMNLTLNYYTEWYWKINLHNLLHFVSLRADSHAQFEIREYATAMLEIIKKWVPLTFEAFEEHRLNGASFSGKAVNVIKDLIHGKAVTQEESGLSKREWNEIMGKLDLNL